MEISPGFIIGIIFAVLCGVPCITCAFFFIRRMHELHTVHNKIEGELYVSLDGGMYAEYGITIPEICERNYILLKVNVIKEGTKDE